VRKKLKALLAAEAKALRRLGIRKLLRRGRTRVPFSADEAGTLAIRLSRSGTGAASRVTVIATGRHTFAAPASAQVPLELTRKGARTLRRARRLEVSLRATFTPTAGTPTAASRTIRLER
jgi:hypothetical protein